MKIIHKDPELHAQRVAAIKKTKRTVAARKKASEALKTFFSDPENRRRRSISMKGTKFFCKNCGQEGHRSPYCPKHGKNVDRRLRCGLCGERGHNQKTCGRPKRIVLKHYHCRACGQLGHNRRTCSVKVEPEPADTLPVNGNSLNDSAIHDRCSLCGQEGHRNHDCPKHGKNVDRRRRCGLCGERGHNYRTCGRSSHPKQKVSLIGHNRRTFSVKVEPEPEPEPADTLPVNGNSLNDSASHDRVRRHRCRLCGEQGHHQKTCGRPKHTVLLQYHCQACGKVGHNRRTCSVNVEPEPADTHTLPVTGNSVNDSASYDQHHHRCSVCGQEGHNNRTCPQISLKQVAVNASKKTRQLHHCTICGVAGHNSRSCFRKQL